MSATVVKADIERCDKEIKDIEEQIAKLNVNKKEKIIECNKKKYIPEQPLKLMDLIKYIFNNDLDNYDKLICLFPESKERSSGLYTKNYVFEALWKIIFLLKFDNLVDVTNFKRNYKKRIENDVHGWEEQNIINEYEYLNGDSSISKINGGSVSGICDFYFTTEKKEEGENNDEEQLQKEKEKSKLWACEKETTVTQPGDAYLFTSKFFGKPKGILDMDYHAMMTEVREIYSDKSQFKIVSLVKHGAELKKKIEAGQKADKTIANYIDSGLIFDEGDMIIKFYPMLFEWLHRHFKKETINDDAKWREILGQTADPIINISENLRFHQKYVVEYTNDLIEQNKIKEETDQNSGRYIWGAVARSGKSYMVGGLVAKRKPRIVLLLLGAINETKTQFIDDLFKKYTDLEYNKGKEGGYKVIDFQSKNWETDITEYNTTDNYVLVISQDSLRVKVEREEKKKTLQPLQGEVLDMSVLEAATTLPAEEAVYSPEMLSFISKCLNEKDKLIFFDEVHQGSGTKSLQLSMIKWLYDVSKEIDQYPILIMVTATYAKPLVKYGKEINKSTGIGDKETVLIEWDYQMIQKMKTFEIDYVTYDENEDSYEYDDKESKTYLIDKNDTFFKEKMTKLKEITDELNKNGKSCEDIAFEYHDSPELVYLLPTLKANEETQEFQEENGEKINIRQNLKEIFELKKEGNQKKFKYQNGVNKLLSYIYDEVYTGLLSKNYDFVANGEGKFHSQLWFLPTSMKNTNPKPLQPTTLKTQAEIKDDDPSIIGPLMRELGIAIVNHAKFKNFNVCVVHGKTKNDSNEVPIASTKGGGTVFFKCITAKGEKREKDVKGCIRDLEHISNKEHKSLIILTGQMLRLGVSLPCTDVAIHMDSIHSYDTIYQSMFRVLTSRPNKKQGFFVDMIFDRAIQFFYEYTVNQKKIKEGDFTLEKHKKDIIRNLLSYDVGSIKQSVGFFNTDIPVNAYSDITQAFQLDSEDRFNEIKSKISKGIYEEKEEIEIEYEIEPELEPEPEKVLNVEEKIKENEKKLISLINLLKNNPEFKQLLTDTKNGYEPLKQKPGTTKKQTQKFNAEPDLGNAPLTAAQDIDVPEEIEEEEIEEEEISAVGIVEQIKNVFTLILLLTTQEDIVINDIFKAYNFDEEGIKKIKECTDEDILYYCYLVVTQRKEHKINDKVIKKIKETEAKVETTQKRKPNRPREEIEREKKLKEERKTLREEQKKEKKGLKGGEGEEEEGTIIHIEKEIGKNGKQKIKYYIIKWDDPEKGEKIYEKSKFDKELENISFSYNYDLSNIDDNKIKNIIEDNIKLIQFLIEKQDRDEPINKLFDNIKEEMGKLKTRLNEEKNAFNDDITQFCPAMYKEGNEKVLEIIRKYLTPKKEEKNLFGEVFTPLTLVCDMLSHLPTNVWKNPNLMWLDPANGIGNFPIVVYFKLMETLKTVTGYSDDKKRSKHIIEKMLFMNELNPVNIAIAKKIFKMIDSDATPNILKGDFLSGATLKDRKFDIIIGNPPYNPKKTESGSSGNTIWPQFVIKSFYMLNEEGILCLVHPPGWKKPTDEIFNPKTIDVDSGDYYKYDKKTGKQTIKQIRQGQLWQVLKDKGSFTFIYTNDQHSKASSIPNFPAVDYYVYQKDVIPRDKGCDTKNIFFGDTTESTGVRLNTDLTYLPNLITMQTQDILHKVTSKEGNKPNFGRFRNGKGFSTDSSKGKYMYIYTYDKNNKRKPQYSDSIGDNNINLDKVIMNFDGGINCYTIEYVKKEDIIGSYEMTMYTKVESDKEGKRIESFFKSDIVKFIFLITQYASGKMTKNEPLVANSITIPPEGITDYYEFFGIEKHQKYIEDILAQYNLFKAPKRKNKENTEVAEEPKQPKPKAAPKATTKKRTSSPKAPVTKTKRRVKIGGKKNKTNKHSKVKIPRKTIRRRKF